MGRRVPTEETDSDRNAGAAPRRLCNKPQGGRIHRVVVESSPPHVYGMLTPLQHIQAEPARGEMALIRIDRPESWPEGLKQSLRGMSQLSIDNQVRTISRALKRHTIRGWHCTRLTDTEVNAIKERGLHPPDRETLRWRLEEVAENGLMAKEIRDRLLAENSASEGSRTGKIWFCFDQPCKRDEGAVGRFFSHWGGEALYGHHEKDSVAGPILAQIGKPRVIEVEVPVVVIDQSYRCAFRVRKQWLEAGEESLGTGEGFDSYSVTPISPDAINKIVTYPERAFCEITGCSNWRKYALNNE